MLRAQDNGGCEDCPAFNAGGKVEVRGVKERIIGDLSATGRGSCKDVDSTDDIGREGSSVGKRK